MISKTKENVIGTRNNFSGPGDICQYYFASYLSNSFDSYHITWKKVETELERNRMRGKKCKQNCNVRRNIDQVIG